MLYVVNRMIVRIYMFAVISIISQSSIISIDKPINSLSFMWLISLVILQTISPGSTKDKKNKKDPLKKEEKTTKTEKTEKEKKRATER